MQNYHHKPIKRFGLDGIINDEANIGRLKDEYTRLLKAEMVLTGYAQRIDINTDFTTRYNAEKQYFEFEISLYGIFVGKNKAQWISGIDGTKTIPILKSKLKEYLQDQV